MHSLSISIVMWVDFLKTVIDYNSADEFVTDSDEIVCDGHMLCLISDNES
jgi:superfamily II RNA helicase